MKIDDLMSSKPMGYLTETKALPTLTYDQRRGIGAVPDNGNVEYLGFKVMMRPSQFLRLAIIRDFEGEDSNLEGITAAIRDGKPIGSPWLDVIMGNESEIARVRQHEGRTRMEAIRRVYGDIAVEVHIFPNGLRARHITQHAISNFRDIAYPQRSKNSLKGPHFD